jgi:uncharacterized protein
MPNSNLVQPVQPHERVQVIDVLRGFALFGILVVNMPLFIWPVYTIMLESTPYLHALDPIAEKLITFFAEGKFFTLFSFLFGLGLAVQLSRGQSKGMSIVSLYSRRLVILLFIGMIHAFLFWWGDILILYAMLGFLLLLFRHRQPKTILAWAIVSFIIPIVLSILSAFSISSSNSGASLLSEDYTQEFQGAIEVYRSSDFIAMIPQRLEDWGFSSSGASLSGMVLMVMTMFLLGLYVGKKGYLQNASEHLPFFRRVFGVCLIVGLLSNSFALFGGRLASNESVGFMLKLLSTFIGYPTLSMAYASGLVLLWQHPVWKKRLQPLANVGRMALTNYLMQTLIATTLAYGYGFGLYAKMGIAAGLGLSIIIYLLQIFFSNLWMKHFKFGPAEWLWRSLTYGRIQAMKASVEHS